MNPDERREVLRAVADGELTPAEAARLLGGKQPPLPPMPPKPKQPPLPPRPRKPTRPPRSPRPDADFASRSDDAIERIRIRAVGAEVTIIGDPSVATIEVDGDHRLSSEGRTLIVRVDDSTLSQTPRSARRTRARRAERPQWMGTHKGPRATIRLNPDLPIRLRADISDVEIRSINSPVTATTNMGMLTLSDVTAPFVATLRAGRLKVDGRLTTGSSRIRAAMGKVAVRLDPTSDVTVRAATEFGNVGIKLADGVKPSGAGEFTLGSGTGSLTIKGSMTSIDVSTIAASDRSPR